MVFDDEPYTSMPPPEKCIFRKLGASARSAIWL